MINPNDFYSNEDSPATGSKFRMWRRISKSIKPEKKKFLGEIELRSFSFGIAAAVIAFFTLIGVYNTFANIAQNKLPENVKINNAYRNAIDDFEKALPASYETKERTVQVDDWISSRREEITNLNVEIIELSEDTRTRDTSPLKQKRLRELYRLKLKIIDEIIELEGIENESDN